jgi:predicted RecB family nuclease
MLLDGIPITRNWVSKTDLTRYLRCPYAFYLLDSGLVRFEETVSEPQIQRIEAGVAFQANVEATAILRAIGPAELTRVFAEESIQLFSLPGFKNPALQIYGQPDAVSTACGALYPVEVKAHKDVSRSDELELAFYWLLMEPYRTKKVPPRGYLLLRRDGAPEQVELEIPAHRFDEVHQLLKEVRDAREHGVEPRICTCTVCSGAIRNEIEQATLVKKDVTRIWGIARARARHLEAIGITSYDRLIDADTSSIVEALRKRKCFVSSNQVDQWKQHARSYAVSHPVLFGPRLPLGASYFALDLEYGPQIIWLFGICLVKAGQPHDHIVLWNHDSMTEAASLRQLGSLLSANPDLPVVTWAGKTADLPQLKAAARRHNLPDIFQMIKSRHLDLYQFAQQSVRFPIPELGLGEVANYFGIPRLSRIGDGLQAQLLFLEYQSSSNDARRAALKTSLCEYNRDDVDALVGIAAKISALHSES